LQKKRAGGVAQGVGPEFKPQNLKKKEEELLYLLIKYFLLNQFFLHLFFYFMLFGFPWLFS
jgi:hypothetical protein